MLRFNVNELYIVEILNDIVRVDLLTQIARVNCEFFSIKYIVMFIVLPLVTRRIVHWTMRT